MGHSVIPFLLEDMQKHKTHWFYALQIITNHNPIQEKNKGNINGMIEDWISWGVKHQYIQDISYEKYNVLETLSEKILLDFFHYANEQKKKHKLSFDIKQTWLEVLEDYEQCPNCNSINWNYGGCSGYDSKGSFQEASWRTCNVCNYSDND